MEVNERQIAEKRQRAAEQFLSQLREFSSNPEVHITNLNVENREDLILASMAALRGKTVEEYFDIVGGLFEAFDQAEGNTAEQDRLFSLSNMVMTIGEGVLGIDWS